MKHISLVTLCLVLGGSSVRAAETRPWAAGITPENQEVAFRIFREANALFEE